MKWGTPADYAAAYKRALTEQYRNMLMAFLKYDAPPGLHQRVLKEIAREEKGKREDHPRDP